MSVIDSFEAPGFREWEAVDLRLIMHQCGLLPEGDGLWIDEPDEINVIVTPVGLFAGWNNSISRLPERPLRRLGDVTHLPRGSEKGLPSLIGELRQRRLAALIQCRFCGEMTPPGHMSDRTCVACLSNQGDIRIIP